MSRRLRLQRLEAVNLDSELSVNGKMWLGRVPKDEAFLQSALLGPIMPSSDQLSALPPHLQQWLSPQ